MYGLGERYGPKGHEVAFHDKQVFFANSSSGPNSANSTLWRFEKLQA